MWGIQTLMWARKTRRIYKYILQFLELSRYLQEDVPVEKGSSFGEAFCAGHCLGTVLGHSISTVPSRSSILSVRIGSAPRGRVVISNVSCLVGVLRSRSQKLCEWTLGDVLVKKPPGTRRLVHLNQLERHRVYSWTCQFIPN